MSKKVYIHTYGCQMNVRDSESVSALLLRSGYTQTADENEADVVIVNTCSVREKAETKALGKLGLLVAKNKENRKKRRIIGAMGCMVQRLQNTIFEKIPGLDFAVGTHRFSSIPKILELVLNRQGHVLDAGEKEECFDALNGHVNNGSISAFVNILFGCSRRCSYCIVPDVRGREWSRNGEEIVDEIKKLVSNGIKEVTLLGQSVMSYGKRNNVWSDNYVSPMGFSEPLPGLLEAVSEIDGLERIRFTSGHPSGCTPELVRAMAELPKICEHLHMPVQSGSDRILKMMRRGYTTREYCQAVERLRNAIPDIAVTTDIIVGFPSETAEDFDMTRQFMEEIQFDNAFIFKYSSRPGTPAADWKDDVEPGEKMRRNKALLAEQDCRGSAINKKLVGKDVKVLVEGKSKRNPERLSGRTHGNTIVVFDTVHGIEPGDLVSVTIERASAQTLYGRVNGSDYSRSQAEAI